MPIMSTQTTNSRTWMDKRRLLLRPLTLFSTELHSSELMQNLSCSKWNSFESAQKGSKLDNIPLDNITGQLIQLRFQLSKHCFSQFNLAYTQGRPSPWDHDACSPCFRFPPYFREIFRLRRKFCKFYLSRKIVSIFIRQNFWWLFLVINHTF